jgi:DNA-binding NarL/FixJ family response regulator
MSIKIGLVDDHQMFLRSLAMLLQTLDGVEVCMEAVNGKDLVRQLQSLPQFDADIILLDVSMPEMDGYETALWLRKNYPTVKLIALSMNDKDRAIIRMFNAGCCAYLLKGMSPDVLEKAIYSVHKEGYFNYDNWHMNPARLLGNMQNDISNKLSKKEMEFLTLACSDLTYKQIAFKMNMSERTIDGYRESLFGKLNVQSRVGLCLEAIRLELVSLDK